MPRRTSREPTDTPGVYRYGDRYVAVASLPGRRQHTKSFGSYEDAVRWKIARQHPTRRPSLGRVYAIQREAGGPIKIGFSKDTDQRLSDLQTSVPEVLTLLGWWPAPAIYERYLHNYFAERRIRGEWFDVSLAEVERAMCDLKRFLVPRGRRRDEAGTEHLRNVTTTCEAFEEVGTA